MKGFSERYQQVGAIRWHLHESAAKPADEQHPVVFVPGLGEGDYMAPHADLLARYWRVFIVDMPGFGRSRAPLRFTRVSEFADALTDFLRGALDVPAYVVASSFGCQIAVAAAVTGAPIARMVLVSPTYDAAARSVLKQLRRWIPTMVVEPPALAIGLTKSYLHCGIRTPIKAFLAGLHDPIEARIAEIEAPTLVVRGERDRIVSTEWAATLTRLLPHGELATIASFAHTLDYAAPHELAAVTVPFLQRVRPPAPGGRRPA